MANTKICLLFFVIIGTTLVHANKCKCTSEYGVISDMTGGPVQAWCSSWSKAPYDWCYLTGGANAMTCPGATKSKTGGIYWTNDPKTCMESCQTVKSQPCIFPFIYKGIKYTQCVNGKHNIPWCSTQNNRYGQYQKWDYCNTHACYSPNDGCKAQNGKACVFPFKYNGRTFTRCTGVGNKGKLWCSTGNTADGSYNTWDLCDLNSCFIPKSEAKPPTAAPPNTQPGTKPVPKPDPTTIAATTKAPNPTKEPQGSCKMKHERAGGCPNYGRVKIPNGVYDVHDDLSECDDVCLQNPECVGYVTMGRRRCLLVKDECSFHEDKGGRFNYFIKSC